MKKVRKMVSRSGAPDPYAYFTKVICSIGNGKYDLWKVWQAFVMLNAIALSNLHDQANAPERTRTYNEIARNFTYEEVALMHHLLDVVAIELGKNPDQDFLGEIFMNLGLNNHWTGQYFTPYNICKLISMISCQNSVSMIEQQGMFYLNDPACGACATLIAGVNNIAYALNEAHPELQWIDHVVVIGQDIDPIAGLMGYIQLSILGCCGLIKIGDTFSDPIREDETDLSKYWLMPWYRLCYLEQPCQTTVSARADELEDDMPFNC